MNKPIETINPATEEPLDTYHLMTLEGAHKVVENCHMVFINGFGLAAPNMPFGEVKNSGHGLEHGGFGMREFVNTKALILAA